MPTYEYTCEGCGAVWEKEQSILDPPMKSCPSCEQPTAKRLISTTAFVLNGRGWAREGYGTTENRRIPKSAR